jgi:outer membrane lipoprotein LolB
MSVSRLPWVILFTAVLASCATVPGGPQPPRISADAVWSERRLHLQEMQSWDFSGRISVTGPDGSWNARIHWTQQGDAYDIYFMSLFGQRVARLEGDRSGVVLQLPEKEPLRALTAEELLASSFGWSAPVDALRYWILGTPQPGSAAETRLDERGRLLRLDQDGWRIEYPQYSGVGGTVGDLPKKLMLDGSPLRIRLVVDAWGIGE